MRSWLIKLSSFVWDKIWYPIDDGVGNVEFITDQLVCVLAVPDINKSTWYTQLYLVYTKCMWYIQMFLVYMDYINIYMAYTNVSGIHGIHKCMWYIHNISMYVIYTNGSSVHKCNWCVWCTHMLGVHTIHKSMPCIWTIVIRKVIKNGNNNFLPLFITCMIIIINMINGNKFRWNITVMCYLLNIDYLPFTYYHC